MGEHMVTQCRDPAQTDFQEEEIESGRRVTISPK